MKTNKKALEIAIIANDRVLNGKDPVIVTDGTVSRSVMRANVIEDAGKTWLELYCPEGRMGNILLEMSGNNLTKYGGAEYPDAYYIAPDWWHKIPPQPPITKEALLEHLLKGETLDEIFEFRQGQECMIFKASEFSQGKGIIYIPDASLNWLDLDVPLNVDKVFPKSGTISAEERIADTIHCCYSGDDFVDLCNGSVELAKKLFNYVDWQHPCSAIDEVVGEGVEEYW